MSIIVLATNPEHISEARAPVIEYTEDLNIDLRFQGLGKELANFPAPYAPPGGALLMAIDKGQALGLVAIKRLDDETCEMKRLYVKPGQRGQHIGRKLAEAAVASAEKLGYRAIRLHTLARMKEAGPLYRSLGFKEVTALDQNPEADVIFMELAL
jgi:putative acetyltransferase